MIEKIHSIFVEYQNFLIPWTTPATLTPGTGNRLAFALKLQPAIPRLIRKKQAGFVYRIRPDQWTPAAAAGSPAVPRRISSGGGKG
jgi:hypothetical protein